MQILFRLKLSMKSVLARNYLTDRIIVFILSAADTMRFLIAWRDLAACLRWRMPQEMRKLKKV